MAKPWSNCSSFLFLFIVTPLLTSCLDLAVSVELNNFTSGRVKVDALAWRLAQGLQAVEGADLFPFPGSRSEWQNVVDQVPGSSLISWEGAAEDRGFRSAAVLGFSTARALEGLFVVFKQKLTLLQDNRGKWTITFVPQVPRVTAADPETRQLWSDLWGTTVWTFSFTPPGQPRVEHRVSLADLGGARPPAEWTVSW